MSESDAAPLVLASTSRYRRAQLEALGLAFETLAPGVDEEALARTGLAPSALATALGRAKAEAGRRLRTEAGQPGAIVIGADQLVDLDGEVLGKPGTADRAVEQLSRMAGRSHRLLTALCVAHDGGLEEHLEITTLHMAAQERQALERYVALDAPLDCAGSYKLEAGGAALFERMEGDDPTAITGLPLFALSSLLRRLGIPVP